MPTEHQKQSGKKSGSGTLTKANESQNQNYQNLLAKLDRKPYEKQSIDDLLTDYCLLKTMGDVVRGRETSTNARSYTVTSMLYNAVFEVDVELIKTIVLRIDGTVPSEKKRDSFANLFGDALDDVMNYERADQLKVVPSDPPIIAMAKALVYIATQPVGNNFQKRKERNLAANIILERIGGRKVEPKRLEIDTVYVEPAWMLGGETSGSGDEEN